MEFRWVALITVWTLLSGPAFDSPDASRPFGDRAAAISKQAEAHRVPSHSKVSKVVPAHSAAVLRP